MKNKNLTLALIIAFAIMAVCFVGCGDDNPVTFNTVTGPTGPTGDAGPTGPTGPTSTAVISGQVTDAVTGSAVNGLIVTATEIDITGQAVGETFQTQAAGNGNYSITVVVPPTGNTRYEVSVKDPSISTDPLPTPSPEPTPEVRELTVSLADEVEKYAPQNRVVQVTSGGTATQNFTLVYVYQFGTSYGDYLEDFEAYQYDDGFVELTLTDDFTFYGSTYSETFMGSNGYLTFGNGAVYYAGEDYYDEEDLTILDWLQNSYYPDPSPDPNITVPVIGGLIGDLTLEDEEEAGEEEPILLDQTNIYHNDFSGGIDVFTWLRVAQYPEEGYIDPRFNTFQIVLYGDNSPNPGEITVYWNGIEAIGQPPYFPVGTGISPGGANIPLVNNGNTDFSSATFPLAIPAGSAIGQEFTGYGTPPYFNMDGGFLHYIPDGNGGYTVTFYPLND